MAGVRQHYIPQLLLRRFASRRVRQTALTWYFRRERPPIEVSIRNVGVAKGFYGAADETCLDDAITAHEGEWAKALRLIETSGTVAPEQRETMAQFMAVMVIRTNHLRQSLTEASDEFLGRMCDKVTALPTMTRFVESTLEQQVPDELRRLIREICGRDVPELEAQAMQLLQERRQQLIDETAREVVPLARLGLDSVRREIPKMVARSHRDSIRKFFENDDSQTRFRHYSGLEWNLVRHEPGTLILGDVGAVTYDPLERQFVVGFEILREGLTLLPISSASLLVGAAGKAQSVPDPDALNGAIAELSLEFFVSGTKTEREVRYQGRLGVRGRLLPLEEMDRIIDQSLP